MRLTSIRVERFRNVLDSGDVPIDPDITCLVGKNESGKTNVLQALLRLNPAQGSRDFARLDYPTWLEKRHQRSGEFDAALPISANFELEPHDVEAVSERFGAGVLTGSSFTVSKSYSNELTAAVEVSEDAAVAALADGTGEDLSGATLAEAAVRRKAAAGATRTDADGTEAPTDTAAAATSARATLAERYPDESAEEAVGDFLLDRVPRFFYFDEYAELAGRTRIEPLIKALKTGAEDGLEPEHRTALSLLQLGFANEDLTSADYETRAGEMQSIAADLTQRIQEYWRQNEYLRLQIDVEQVAANKTNGESIIERYLQLRVVDDRHHHSNSLDARSSGFRWFVSFLAAFTEFEEDEDVIILLDEPALALHARAQADFLHFIETTLAAHHQVLYTTHSPFMVDPGHLERVRVVEDSGPEVGSVVRTQLMSHDPDTLSPLQGALGYDIAQNLFVGPDNLVVEGLSDYTYLTVMSEVLRDRGRAHLDPRWRVLPAGGAGTMPAVVALVGQELDATVVVDGGKRPPQKLANLVDEGLLDGTRVIVLGELTGLKKADIEDLFHVDDYLRFYNGALGAKVTTRQLGDSGDGIVSRIERSVAKYNHNDPANWLLEHRSEVLPSLSDETLAGFEELFERINRTLSTG